MEAGVTQQTRSPGFIRRIFSLALPYWQSEEKWKVRWLTAALGFLTVAQVLAPISLNIWSENLFDALEEHSMGRFVFMIGVLGLIILGNLAITTTHLRLKRQLQMGWRKWLTRSILSGWMTAGHHYQVTHLPGEHDNPDGRIAEDVRIVTEYALDLAHSLLYCLLLLISFTKILWSLSGMVHLQIDELDIPIPGHLVWIALAYASVGTSVALLLGRPLVRAVNHRQTCEANFRFGLVHARENSEAIALIHGEADERRRFADLFRRLAEAWHRQTRALLNIFMFTSSYSVLSTAVPVLIGAPRYISGSITLGVLMQTAQAFQQMEAALSWPIDNLSKGAEWRASVERVLGLHESLEKLEENVSNVSHTRISVERGDSEALLCENLSVHDPDGQVIIGSFNVHIGLGERVLIAGDPGAAVKFFKVVAELWPWGAGQLRLPRDASIFFMPQRPYLPTGPLHTTISYPAPPDAFEMDRIAEALRTVGLEQLIPRLDENKSWEKTLTAGEQQKLGFARLLLHQPNWIFIQEATDAMDPASEEEMMRLVQSEFTEATVMTVGYHASLEAFHQRKLVLARAPNGLVLLEDRRKTTRVPLQTPRPRRFYSQLVKFLRNGGQTPKTPPGQTEEPEKYE